jgi:Holliday junction resolvase
MLSPTDLDELMSRDPLKLSDNDIEAIIEFHRKARARRAAGEKPSKPASASVDISSVVSKLVTAAAPKITRRI